MNKIVEATKLLEKYGQNHIKVDSEELAEQVLKIDFEQLEELYEEIKNNQNLICDIKDVEPVKAINPDKIEKETLEEYKNLGRKKVESGKFAVAIMAGGQGTRLGHKGPKGTFKLTLNSTEKSLFEVIIDKLKKSNKEYNITLSCYIMTSTENHDETVKFFEDANYFGYPKENIIFFKQGDLPLLNKQGKIIKDENGKIKMASNGNGGIFYSMKKNGIIDDMKKKNIEWVFIGSVDNLLVKYVDVLLLGLAISKGVKIATRTIIKNSPYEKVRSFVQK